MAGALMWVQIFHINLPAEPLWISNYKVYCPNRMAKARILSHLYQICMNTCIVDGRGAHVGADFSYQPPGRTAMN